MKSLIIAVVVLATPLVALAKLPAPTPEQQAKAAEAKAKADEIAKQEAQQVLRYQHRAVANYQANARAQGKPFHPTPIKGDAVTLPAGGTVATTDKVVPKPAEAASDPAARAGAQPSQTAGVPQDSAGGAGAPPQQAQQPARPQSPQR